MSHDALLTEEQRLVRDAARAFALLIRNDEVSAYGVLDLGIAEEAFDTLR
jgi:hypothetical protein